jgi:hypothetical protein
LANNYFGVLVEIEQLSLFDDNNRTLFSRRDKLVMDKDALTRWKQRIFEYQNSVRNSKPPQQQTLFDLPKTTWHAPDEIDPFSLKLHPADFYRKPEPPETFDNPDRGCIYFILDRTLPILLYIGETKLTAHQRWSGVHYCKDYVMSYIEMHRRYKLDVAVCSAFWQHVPPDKKVLLAWERELILKWRSPFNRENWNQFGQPFGKR